MRAQDCSFVEVRFNSGALVYYAIMRGGRGVGGVDEPKWKKSSCLGKRFRDETKLLLQMIVKVAAPICFRHFGKFECLQ